MFEKVLMNYNDFNGDVIQNKVQSVIINPYEYNFLKKLIKIADTLVIHFFFVFIMLNNILLTFFSNIRDAIIVSFSFDTLRTISISEFKL